MDNIFINAILKKRIMLKPNQISKDLNDKILHILKKKVEGICIKEGYVKEDSIKILKKSIGKIQCNQFKGNIYFDIIYTADICNPPEGSIIKCNVDNINKLGILSNKDCLSIIIAKQYHVNKSIFKDIKLNQEIIIEVIGKKFIVNDNKISVIAKITDNKNKKPVEIKLDNTNSKNSLNNLIQTELDDTYTINDIGNDSADEEEDEDDNIKIDDNEETFHENFSNKESKNIKILKDEESDNIGFTSDDSNYDSDSNSDDDNKGYNE
jgi:DNA-directed RNA polymerase subunit E'/Rpb7